MIIYLTVDTNSNTISIQVSKEFSKNVEVLHTIDVELLTELKIIVPKLTRKLSRLNDKKDKDA